jgi:hypothetical protein
MQRIAAALAAAALVIVAACSSADQSRRDTPPVDVAIALVDTPSDIFYFPGPVNLRFAVKIANPSAEPVTLRRLDLRTPGGGAVRLRATGTPMKVTVNPHSSAAVTVSAWGNSFGGYLAVDEPIQLQGTAYFDSAKGPFVKLFNSMLSTR